MLSRWGFASLLTFIAVACAQEPDAALPAPVAAALSALTEQCTSAGGTPRAANAVQRAELNGDALDDFVLYAGDIACDGAASLYGDREKLLIVFAAEGPHEAVEAFVDAVYGFAIERDGGAAALWITTSARQCGREPASTFAEETFCDRALVWNREAARFDYAAVETVRILQ